MLAVLLLSHHIASVTTSNQLHMAASTATVLVQTDEGMLVLEPQTAIGVLRSFGAPPSGPLFIRASLYVVQPCCTVISTREQLLSAVRLHLRCMSASALVHKPNCTMLHLQQYIGICCCASQPYLCLFSGCPMLPPRFRPSCSCRRASSVASRMQLLHEGPDCFTKHPGRRRHCD